MGVNRLTGMNTGFGQDIFMSVDEAIRNENKKLMEQEKVNGKSLKESDYGDEDYSYEEMQDWIADAQERKAMGETNDEIWEYIVNETGNHYLADDVVASLPESEQDLANEPTQRDFDNDEKANKEAKKQEIENKMESIIDAMHNTQIDSEEAKALAGEFQELQSELAKLELEECPLNIKEEEMKFAEEFCSKCGAKLDADGKPEKTQEQEDDEYKFKKVDENIKEDSYEEGIFYEIEQALEEAGLNPRRFVDDGIMTNNIGWTVSNGSEEQQISCDGSYLSEGCKKDKITETEVKNIKPIKQQGNVFMLEDEDGKVIVGEDFNEEDGLIQNAEVYDDKNEADKDYMKRCDIVKTESVKECDDKSGYNPDEKEPEVEPDKEDYNPDEESIGLPDFSPNEELNRKMAGKKIEASKKTLADYAKRK